jgi:hypothetical protein
MESSASATILNVPFQLRANDITKHIVNVDSRFRDSPGSSTSADFFLTLATPVRNILRVRITSVEFPNNYFIFTAKRQNVSFQILYGPGSNTFTLTVADGNYSACEMADAMNAILDASGSPVSWLSVAFDEINGSFTFTGSRSFIINTVFGSRDRPFDYGLGFNLGFTRGLHAATASGATGIGVPVWTVTSDLCANFAGDSYFFLRLNDYGCVRQTLQTYDASGRSRVEATSFTALAKVLLRDPKNYMTYDDYASQHAKEYVFPNPIDLTRLHVQAVDPYGVVMDLCSAQWSFSVEVLEIKNLSMYNTVRDSIGLQYR